MLMALICPKYVYFTYGPHLSYFHFNMAYTLVFILELVLILVLGIEVGTLSL